MSVGYAIRNPWSHPWILDALEHLNLYTADTVASQGAMRPHCDREHIEQD